MPRVRRTLPPALAVLALIGLGVAVRAAGGPEFTNSGDVTAVAPGGPMTCALDGGVAWCWGRAMSGSLGDGGDVANQYNVTTPARVATTATFTNNGTVSALAAGETHACAIEDGVLHCWGSNWAKQLGDGTVIDSSTAVKVLQNDGAGFVNTSVTAVAAGTIHTCAVRAGIAFCWGQSQRGLLGQGTVNDGADRPVKVSRPQGLFANNGSVSAISAGTIHTCAIDDGRVFCWGGNRHSGDANIGGYLGTGDLVDKYVATQVLSANGFSNNGTVSAVAVGYSTGNTESHTCAIEGGVLYCWGVNTEGQLGFSPLTVTQSAVPVAVPAANGFTNTAVTDVSLGREFTCAVEAGTVFCWGINNFGQLGDGLAVNAMNRFAVPRPVTVSASGFANTTVSSVVAGMYHACAVEDGTAFCWGHDGFGRLGDQVEGDFGNSTPVKVGTAAAAAEPDPGPAPQPNPEPEPEAIPIPATEPVLETPPPPVSQPAPVVVPAPLDTRPTLLDVRDAPRLRQEPGAFLIERDTLRTRGRVTSVTPGSPDTPHNGVPGVEIAGDERSVLLSGRRSDGTPAPVIDGALHLGPGGTIVIELSDFPPGAQGEVVLMSTPRLLGGVTIATSGGFAGQYSVPEELAPGPHTLVLALDGLIVAVGVMIEGGPAVTAVEGDLRLPASGPTRNLVLLLLLATVLSAAGLTLRSSER